MEGVYFMEGNNFNINKDKEVKVIEYEGNKNIEIQDTTSDGINYLKDIKKISKYEYIDKNTGEIHKYNLEDTKTKSGLKKSMNRLRKKLLNNFTGEGNELITTLTTTDDVSDINIMIEYFNQFMYRLKKVHPKIEYVCVPEKHTKRDSWHLHVLLKDRSKRNLYISNDDIETIFWKYGYSKTNRIGTRNYSKSTNRQSAEYSDNEEIGIDRLVNYLCKINVKEEIPQGFRSYYCSRGIKAPKTTKRKYGDVCDEMKDMYQLEKEKTTLIKSLRTDKILRKIKTEKWTRLK